MDYSENDFNRFQETVVAISEIIYPSHQFVEQFVEQFDEQFDEQPFIHCEGRTERSDIYRHNQPDDRFSIHSDAIGIIDVAKLLIEETPNTDNNNKNTVQDKNSTIIPNDNPTINYDEETIIENNKNLNDNLIEKIMKPSLDERQIRESIATHEIEQQLEQQGLSDKQE